jgi:hypothetical protein
MVAPTAPLVSVGEAITVAMVAGALGFACAENLVRFFSFFFRSVVSYIVDLLAKKEEFFTSVVWLNLLFLSSTLVRFTYLYTRHRT